MLDLSPIDEKELDEGVRNGDLELVRKYSFISSSRCDARAEWYCSRERGHVGIHIALYGHCDMNRVLEVWDQSKKYFDAGVRRSR